MRTPSAVVSQTNRKVDTHCQLGNQQAAVHGKEPSTYCLHVVDTPRRLYHSKPERSSRIGHIERPNFTQKVRNVHQIVSYCDTPRCRYIERGLNLNGQRRVRHVDNTDGRVKCDDVQITGSRSSISPIGCARNGHVIDASEMASERFQIAADLSDAMTETAIYRVMLQNPEMARLDAIRLIRERTEQLDKFRL